MIINRMKVLDKYSSKCAYCGCQLTLKTFQVDHIWPLQLSHWHKDLDPNRPENLNPSCAKCNNYKHGMRLDEFRAELGEQVFRLKQNAQFDRALRYSQIKITESPIVFYFEMEKNEL